MIVCENAKIFIVLANSGITHTHSVSSSAVLTPYNPTAFVGLQACILAVVTVALQQQCHS